MDWGEKITDIQWNKDISNKEEKQRIALEIAKKVKNNDVIGFGSGSTSFLAICAIAEKVKKENIKIIAIPTSYEIERVCNYYSIPTSTLNDKRPDWCFDGVDEIDNNNWMIKGRGAAMFKEKLNILNSSKTYILADESKFSDKLGSKAHIPIEVFPTAIKYVKTKLEEIGAKEIKIRMLEDGEKLKITDNGNAILDTKFEEIDENLEKKIKGITGVIESGLFIKYNVEVIK